MSDDRASKRQQELLNFVDTSIQGNGYGPSYREIMRALGYKSVSTVAIHIDNLIAKGYLIKRDHSARSLEVVSRHYNETKTAAKPESTLEKLLLAAFGERYEAYNNQSDKKKAARELAVLVETMEILGFDQAKKNSESQMKKLADLH